ncbi:leucine-rich repeat domain-containing protein [Pseudoalteromonas maricaloris]|uniref:leucine-rich repeat domain-containing protein n=1 Tax=Pseudoalteromonas maricaloris TaxID=184924 RepID=UPI003C1E70F2
MAHYQNHAAWKIALERIQKAHDNGNDALDLSNLRLRSIPKEINCLAGQLNTLDISSCSGLFDITHIADLTELTELMLQRNRQLSDLSPLLSLQQLKTLDLSWCHALSDLSELNNLPQLQQLNLSGCEALSNLSGLNNLLQLQQLNLSECEALTDLSGLNNLPQLQQLDLSGCEALSDLSGLNNLPQLQQLDLSWCHALSDLSGLNNLPQLQQLNLSGCEVLSNLSGLNNLLQLQQLNLSECEALTDLSGLNNLSQLQQLDLSGCEALSDLSGLNNLPQLQQLDLSRCQTLSDLSGLNNLPQLQRLNLSGCEALSDLSELNNLPQLQQLDLSGCEALSDLSGLNNLPQLQQLDLSRCQTLSDLSGLSNLPQLQRLNLSGCEALSDLSELNNQPQLQQLDLSGCEALSDLSGLNNLPQLQQLDLHWCDALSDLSGLNNLPQLQQLDLRECNALSDLSGLNNLPQLQQLDLSGCEALSDLSELNNLPQLQQLDLSGCEALSDLSGLNNLSQLQQLDLHWCDALSDLSGLNNLPQLQQLDLRECDALSDLSGLNNLPQLQQLDLSGCEALSDLSGLNNLSQLQQLDLHWCDALSDLSGLNNLPQLQQLDLRECDALSDLSGLNNLSQLQQLDLSGCEALSDLSELNNLPQLQQLDLSGCEAIKHLPKFTQLPHLKMLDLSYCENLLPLSQGDFLTLINELPFLNYLHTHSSNLKIIGVPEELTQNTHNLLALEDYYFALQQSGEVTVNQQKLMILGNGRIGKTQLTRRLQGLSFDDTIPSTHGIQINVWQDKQGKDIYSWDFGGQDIYLGTHALFLDDRAVYCLLWHPDFEDEKVFDEKESGIPMKNHLLSYWLAYIDSIAGEKAPVIVCQSQCDSPSEVQKAPIPPHNFNWLQPVQISAKNNDLKRFQPQLDWAFEYQAERIGEIKLPKCWWAVAQTLLEQKQQQQRVVEKDAYLALCEQYKVSAPDSLLMYLHRCGLVFYKAGLFNDQLILDQAWALQGVYSLLERGTTLPVLQKQHGQFSQALLAELLWSEYQYSDDEQQLFLTMMRQCGVCFKIAEDSYIAPDCLPERVDQDIQRCIEQLQRGASAKIEVELNYAFLHEGSQRSILSAIGEQAGKYATYWRYGCCYYDDKHRTVVYLQCEANNQLSEDELAHYGHPGRIQLKLYSEQAHKLANHIIDSILQSHQLGKPPSVHWLKGQPVNIEEQEQQQDLPFAKLGEAKPTEPLSEVYFSYAWGKESDRHQKVCDELYEYAQDFATPVRDRNNTNTGDSILGFEQQIGQAELVVVILSDKYLKSEHCMRELNYVYQSSLNNGQKFNQRICPFILDNDEDDPTDQGVNINTMKGRLAYTKYWKTELTEIESLINEVGPEAAGQEAIRYQQEIRSFMNNIVNMLTWISDQIVSRDPSNYEETLKDLINRKSNH